MNLDIVWSDGANRGDWQVVAPGRLSTGNLLVTAVIISLFTDRRSNPVNYPDHWGWWMDTFDGVLIGSRLHELRRRKIADRNALIAEATDMIREALQWLIDQGIAASVGVLVTSPPAGAGQPGSLLRFHVTVVQPSGSGPATIVRALWKVV